MRRVHFKERTKPVKRIDPAKFVYIPGKRLVGRRTTFRGLLEEIDHGTSLVKLYAGLLVETLVKEDPKVGPDYRVHRILEEH
jgi:hypothetical protein